MKKEIADKWCAALRSGEYKQSIGRLRRAEGYCCLGVLSDLSKQGEWNKSNDYGSPGDWRTGELNIAVMNWSGIRTSGACVKNTYLSTMNDKGKTFEEIADVIEKHWKEL